MKEILMDGKYIGIILAGVLVGNYYIRKTINNMKIQRQIKKAGREGENQVSRQLSSLDKNKFKKIDNMLIKFKNGGSTQLDHVLISPGGIIAIETKNFSGKIYGDVNQKNWKQINDNGPKTKHHEFYSPVMQNDGHIKALNYILNKTHNIPIYSMIAFSQKADLSGIKGNRKDLRIIHIENINREVLNISKKNILDSTQIKEVYKILKKEDNSGIIEDMIHVQNIKKQK